MQKGPLEMSLVCLTPFYIGHFAELWIGLDKSSIRAMTHDLTILDHVDNIALFYRRQTVGDNNIRLLMSKVIDGLRNNLFRDTIERACGFVKNEYDRIMVQGAGNADALALPSTEPNSAVAD